MKREKRKRGLTWERDMYRIAAFMVKQRIQIKAGEIFGAALIAMVVMAVGFLPRVMASSGVMDLQELQKTHQSADCTPKPSPSSSPE
jgi:hypothetical protein